MWREKGRLKGIRSAQIEELFLPLSLECRSAPIAVKSLRSAPRLLHFVSALRVTAPGASLRSWLKKKKAKKIICEKELFHSMAGG
jgi:hypothetical protein